LQIDLSPWVRKAQAQAAAHEHAGVIETCTRALSEVGEREGVWLPAELVTELYFLRGDAGRYIGRWLLAETDFGSCYELAAQAGIWPRAGRALRLQGEVYLRLKRTEEAIAAFRRAVEIAAEHGDQTGVLWSQAYLARALSDHGEREEALALASQVIEKASAATRKELELRDLILVTAYNTLSLIHFRGGRLAEAHGVALAGLRLLPRVNHPLTAGRTYRMLAILEGEQRSYSTAISYLHRALQVYEEAHYEPGRYDAYWSLAVTYVDMGDLRNAQLCLHQCAEIAQRLELKLELGKTKSRFGDIALREGNYQQALELYREDLTLTQEIGDRQALGYCHRNLALCYRLLNRLPQAERHAKESRRAFTATQRRTLAALAQALLAEVYLRQGRLDEAEGEIEAAGRILESQGEDEDRAAVYRVLALLARERNDYARAEQYFERSLQAHRRQVPTRELAETCYDAGETMYRAGRHPAALRYLRAAIELAGVLGSRDIRLKAVQLMEEIDRLDAQRMKLAPYLPSGAVDELSTEGQEAEQGYLTTLATVMFVDMRGSTSLSEALTPLEMAQTVDAFLGPVVRIIIQNGGAVDKFIGDCVMAVFGMRQEGTGAAEAVRAGWEIVEYLAATTRVRREAGASVLEASIGINTGEVLAGCFGPLLKRDYTVLGYHVNLAERLQDLASDLEAEAPNRLVISGSTYREVATWVEATRLPVEELQLKGIDLQQVEAWLVTGIKPVSP